MASVDLPFEIVDHIIQYLNEAECWALFRAKVWPSLQCLLRHRRHVNLQKAFFLSIPEFEEYFEQCVEPDTVRIFNISHCYVLPKKNLAQAVLCLKHVEDINVQGTELTVSEVMQFLLQCSNLTRLAMSIKKTEWSLVREVSTDIPQPLKQCMDRLTHLKISWAAVPPYWNNLLVFLECFHNIENLHLEPCYEHSDDWFEPEEVNWTRVKNLPFLHKLRSLICTRKKYDSCFELDYEAICHVMVQQLNLSQMENLWIQCKNQEPLLETIPSTMKTYWLETISCVDFSHCRHLTHLGGLKLDSSIFLPNLRHVSGIFSSYQGLFQFLELHPKLEFLSIRDYAGTEQANLPPNFFNENAPSCKLTRLRKLVYWIDSSHRDALDILLMISPNLEELNLSSWSRQLNNFFDELASCPKLRKVKIDGISLNCAPRYNKVLQRCNRLESLQISVCCLTRHSKFFKKLSLALPLSINLREFRLDWSFSSGLIVIKVLEALCNCRRLQRVVLNEMNEGVDQCNDQSYYYWLPELVVEVATALKELIFFCLILDVDCNTLQETRQLFDEKIAPLRPCLWFDVYSQFPSSHGIPQVHYEEIIYIANEVDCYPKFW